MDLTRKRLERAKALVPQTHSPAARVAVTVQGIITLLPIPLFETH